MQYWDKLQKWSLYVLNLSCIKTRAWIRGIIIPSKEASVLAFYFILYLFLVFLTYETTWGSFTHITSCLISRLCGRPFCYYCCSNTVSTQQGGNRERCCTDCYNQHSAVVERHPQDEVTSTPGTPFSRLLQAGRALSSVSGCKHTRAPSLSQMELKIWSEEMLLS